MVAAEAPDEHDRVQADEHDRRHRIAADQARGAPHQKHYAQAREHQQPLQEPERHRHAQRHDRESDQREQRSIRAQQLMPVARGIARVVVRLEHRDRRVRVEAMDNLHAPVVDVVEDVGERQRRREEHDRVCSHDRRDHPARAQQGHIAQADQVADVHEHDRGREQPPQTRCAARQRRPQATERARHPAREIMTCGRSR